MYLVGVQGGSADLRMSQLSSEGVHICHRSLDSVLRSRAQWLKAAACCCFCQGRQKEAWWLGCAAGRGAQYPLVLAFLGYPLHGSRVKITWEQILELCFGPVALCAPEASHSRQMEDESFLTTLHPFHTFLAWSSVIGGY